MGLFGNTERDKKFEDHRERGYDGPIDQDGDAVMSRRSDKSFGWLGTGSPDDPDSPRAGNAARRARRS